MSTALLSSLSIRRQPLLNQHKAIVGHTWHFDHLQDNHSRFNDVWQSEAFQAHLLQGKAFVRLPHSWLKDEVFLSDTNWSSLVLEIDNQDRQDASCLRVAKHIRQHGGELSLANFDGSDAAMQLLGIVQYVKVNTQQADSKTIQQLKQKPVTIIATHVDSEAKFHQDLSHGCDWCEGTGFTRPVMDDAQTGVNHATLLRTLAELNNPKADLQHLATVVGQDISLTQQLMTTLNSASMALPAPVTSLLDAVRMLGTKRLAFWVSLLMLSQIKNTPTALLYTALARARFMEQVAEQSNAKAQRDTWFLAGLLSTLDAFLRLPMAKAIEDMPLADDIQDALLHQVGDIGHVLALVFTLEGTGASVNLSYETLDVCKLSMLYVQASGWAYQVWSQPS